MNNNKLKVLAQRMLALNEQQKIETGEESVAISSDRFTDLQRFGREKERLFRQQPHLVAMTADLPDSGDFLALTVADLPVFIIRNERGEVRAFINACRHRAAQLLEGRGNEIRIQCPYHGWTYNPDGHLQAVPHKALFTDTLSHQQNLLALPVLEYNGMIFVYPQSDGEYLMTAENLLGDLLPELAGFDLGKLNFIAERDELIEMNWKLGNDFVMEGYHVHHLHKNTVGLMSLPAFAHDSFGPHHRLVTASPSLLELQDQQESQWDAFSHLTLVHSLFPSSMLVVSKMEVFLQRVEPADTPGQSRVRLSTYTWDEMTTEEQRKPHLDMFELLYTVQREEDLKTMEGCQRAFNSGALESIVLGKVEPLLQAIHRQINQALE